MYSNELTTVITGWSERSYMLLKTFIAGLHGEKDTIPGVMLGELNGKFRIIRLIYRFEGQRNLDTSGMWLFGRELHGDALFFTPDLHLGYGGSGAAYGEMLLKELGVREDEVARISQAIMHKECEVIFELDGDGVWHGSYKLLVTV